MIPKQIVGRVYVVGDNVDTDVIIPARYLTTMDPQELKKHLFEDLPNKDLYEQGMNILIAGNNFGCGSSREHAPIAIAAAGIEAVVASSFARIYWRNSINAGKPLPLECPHSVGLCKIIKTGSEVKIDLLESPRIWYRDESKVSYGDRGDRWSLIKPLLPIPAEILEAGGLTEYNLKRLQKK